MKKKANSTKSQISFVIIITNIFNAMAVDIYLPSLPQMQEFFNTTEYKIQLIIVGFYFGAVLSRLFWGPFSDIIGRRRAILISYAIQAAFQLMCIYSSTVDWIIFFRILQSLGSGVTSVVGIAIIADHYIGNERARMLNFLELSFITAFIFAPFFGIILNIFYGWQGGFVFIFISYIISFILFYYFLTDTDDIVKNDFYNLISKIFYIYKNEFSLNVIKFSLISGISTGLFMGFSIKAPFIYFLNYSIPKYEYILLQMSPFMIHFVISILYKEVINKISISRTISLSLIALFFISFLNIYISQQIIYPNKYTYFFIMCYISAVLPFLTTGGITLTLNEVTNKGAGASISSSIRSFCIFSVMYISSKIGIESHYLFYIIPILTILLIVLWCSIRTNT